MIGFFKWINFLLFFLFLAAFGIILYFGVLSVDTTPEKRALVIEILVAATILPALLFFFNGLVMGAKQKKIFKSNVEIENNIPNNVPRPNSDNQNGAKSVY